MKTITLTQEEYQKQRAFCYNDNKVFEKHLKQQLQNYSVCKDHNGKCYERFTKAKLMLEKLQFEKYDLSSIELDGKGVDRFVTYIEYQDGNPLTVEELDELQDNDELHQRLIECKFI